MLLAPLALTKGIYHNSGDGVKENGREIFWAASELGDSPNLSAIVAGKDGQTKLGAFRALGCARG